MSESAEHFREFQIAAARVEPGMSADDLRATLSAMPDAQAVVLEGYVSGGIPEVLNPVIEEYTKAGKPVFVVASNYAWDRGSISTNYEGHTGGAAAGIIPIESKNVNRFREILDAIQDEIDAGKRGSELAKTIYDKHRLHNL